MNVTKTEKGYAITVDENTTFELDRSAALALSEFIDKEYYREDMKQIIDDKYGEGTADKLPDELFDEIVEEYDAKRSESEEWSYLGNEAVDEYKEQIKNILGEKEITE